MSTLIQNIRYALRQLRKSPGFACTVVLTLALGVCANAVVFSVLNALILRPLTLPDAKQLVFFDRVGNTGRSPSSPSQSYPDYRDLRDRNHSFSGVAAYKVDRVGVEVAGVVEKSWFYGTTDNYFDVLGVQPALGRFFHPADVHGPNSAAYAVLAYSYWQRHLGGNPSIVGQTIELNKHPFTVLGVAPKSFTGTELFFGADLWVPLSQQEQLEGYNNLEARGDHSSWVIGRLKPGVSVTQATADVNTVARQLARQYLEDESLGFTLSRPGLLGDLLGGPVRLFLIGVMGLAGLVLLAACANLGSLFAARAADRARELAVRLALGASRAALVRQLVTEAVVVSLAGGVLGLLGAQAVLRALSLWRPSPDFPLQVMVNADVRVSVLALLLALGAGLFFGLVPVQQVWREDASLALKSGPSGCGAMGRFNLRDALLVLQIVLCSVLVTSSLVAVRGLERSLHTSYGFQPEGALLASFDLQMVGYRQEQALLFHKHAMDAIAALPGVTAVGLADNLPLSLSTTDSNVYADGTTDFRDSHAIADASRYDVSPGYLAAAQTRLLSGRDFSWHDDDKAPRVAIINQTLARKLYGPANALGRYFIRGSQRWQVIGIVEDGKYVTLTEPAAAAMFYSTARSPDTRAIFVIRSRAGQAVAAPAVHTIFSQLEPGLPVTISSWPAAMGMVLFPSIAATAALGVMGGVAAILAVTGIFGMASYAVSRRMRELGLRVALGAGRTEVLAAALGRPARLLLFGSLAGLTLGALASRLLAHIVYQATTQDPVVLVGSIAGMALLGLAATLMPARRALQVDPVILLRDE